MQNTPLTPKLAVLAAVLALVSGCSKTTGVGGTSGEATSETLKVNAEFAKNLNLADQQDFENAKKGFIAKPTGKLVQPDGTVLKDFDVYSFLDGKAADTVNPSLWRHAQLNANIGLYEVMDGVYQLRGFDIANITLIDGKTGWILVDPLTARESSKAALDFARQHLGNKPVSAIIFTHAHADHYGGILGVVSPEEVAQRKIPIIAPEGFMEEATSENVLVGTGMARRSMYSLVKTCHAVPPAMWTPAWAKTWCTEASASCHPTP